MFEVKGNLWDLPADAIVITTNGFVKKNGSCVMGKGCALEAKKLYPKLEYTLGAEILAYGNHVHWLTTDARWAIFSFPVKHNWWEKADLNLIERSCTELVTLVDNSFGKDRIPFIAVPRPGCGNGQLDWADVKPICEKYFDNRFGIVTF